MGSSFRSSNDFGECVICDCRLKARFAVAGTKGNHGRKFYGCLQFNKGEGFNFFRWVKCGNEKERGMQDVMEERRLKELIIMSMVEEGGVKLQSLRKEKSLLWRIAFGNTRELSAPIDDGEPLQRMKGYGKAEIGRLKMSVNVYKYMLIVT